MTSGLRWGHVSGFVQEVHKAALPVEGKGERAACQWSGFGGH